MIKTICPECDAEIEFHSHPKLRDRISCAQCQSDLVVIKIAPLELDWAFMEPFEGRVHGNNGRHSRGMT